jgi:anti-sigma regulatory factor (Ser/Thr protein kinase)
MSAAPPLDPDPDGSGAVTFTLKAVQDASRIARERVRAMRGPVAHLPDLELLLSELVSNVVRHSGMAKGEPIAVSITAGPGHVVAEVTDRGRGFQGDVVMPEGRPPYEGGYGLVLVDRIATRWGVIESGAGTTVWFALEG